jgi:Lar family restriction alleviation protein
MSEAKMTAELLPCPFCGGEAYVESYGPGKWQGGVYCSTEGCSADGHNHDSEDAAVAAWNRRAELKAPRFSESEREALEKIIEAAESWDVPHHREWPALKQAAATIRKMLTP